MEEANAATKKSHALTRELSNALARGKCLERVRCLDAEEKRPLTTTEKRRGWARRPFWAYDAERLCHGCRAYWHVECAALDLGNCVKTGLSVVAEVPTSDLDSVLARIGIILKENVDAVNPVVAIERVLNLVASLRAESENYKAFLETLTGLLPQIEGETPEDSIRRLLGVVRGIDLGSEDLHADVQVVKTIFSTNYENEESYPGNVDEEIASDED